MIWKKGHSYHIEEIKLEKRGKLIITKENKVTEIYYEEEEKKEAEDDKSLLVSIYDSK